MQTFFVQSRRTNLNAYKLSELLNTYYLVEFNTWLCVYTYFRSEIRLLLHLTSWCSWLSYSRTQARTWVQVP